MRMIGISDARRRVALRATNLAVVGVFVALAVLVGGLPVGVGAQEAPDAATGRLAVVRIVARLIDDGRAEFGLQSGGESGDWNARILPQRRFLPAGAAIGRWLVSSPLAIDVADGSGGSVQTRIAARRGANQRIEFALQLRDGDGGWGERFLPQRRFLPGNSRRGAWLVGSALELRGLEPAGAPSLPAPLPPEPAPATTTTTAAAATEPGDPGGFGAVDITEAVQAILGREDISDEDGFHADAVIVAGEVMMTALVNALRLSLDLPELAYRLDLASVARGWSETMASESSYADSSGGSDHFRHNPEYSSQYPPGWWMAGENIAQVYLGSSEDHWQAMSSAVHLAFEGLADSPGHYANMVEPGYDAIGVGIAVSGRQVYVTQNFAAYR